MEGRLHPEGRQKPAKGLKQEGAAVGPEFRVDLFGSHWRVVH